MGPTRENLLSLNLALLSLYNLFINFFLPFQVIRWIHSAEGMLSAGFSIPGSLQDAEQLKKEHEQFQTAIEVIIYTILNNCLERVEKRKI